MTTRLLCYANKGYLKNQKRLVASACKFGIEKIDAYTEKDLKKTSFYKENGEILRQKRGGGYWLWKPYYILETLKHMKDGDILVYSDSGIEIIAPVDPLVRICQEKNIAIFSVGHYLNNVWTKRDCFVLTGCDSERYWKGRQYMAGFLLFKNTKESREFVAEWLVFAQNKHILTDVPNTCGLPNLPEFVEHRHDQAILSLLAEKYGIEMFRDPSQHGNPFKSPEWRKEGEFLPIPYFKTPFTNSPYGTILDIHRTRPHQIQKRILGKIKVILSKIGIFTQ